MEQLPGSHIWWIFTESAVLVNFAFGGFSIYRFIASEGVYDCFDIIWFYSTYGNFLLSCCLMYLYIASPKKELDRTDEVRAEDTLILFRIVGLTLGVYLVNTITLFVGLLDPTEDQQYCIGKIPICICEATFFICWISILLAAEYSLQLITNRAIYSTTLLNAERDNQIELTLII